MRGISYACLGGVEISNGNRIETYLREQGIGLAGNIGACDCDALNEPYPFFSQSSDPAPWFDPNVPESEEFFGCWLSDVILQSVMARSATARVGGGAVLGPLNLGKRIIQCKGILFASTGSGMAYGERWLNRALAGSFCGGGCAPDDLEILPACPEFDDQMSYQEEITSDGAFLYWRFDEPAHGLVIYDHINSNDGMYEEGTYGSGAPSPLVFQVVPGPAGDSAKRARFPETVDPTFEYGDVIGTIPAIPPGPFWAEVLVWTENLGNDTFAGLHPLQLWGASSQILDIYWPLHPNTDPLVGVPYVQLINDAGQKAYIAPHESLATGEWHTIAVSVNPGHTVELFIDGMSSGTTTAPAGPYTFTEIFGAGIDSSLPSPAVGPYSQGALVIGEGVLTPEAARRHHNRLIGGVGYDRFFRTAIQAGVIDGPNFQQIQDLPDCKLQNVDFQFAASPYLFGPKQTLVEDRGLGALPYTVMASTNAWPGDAALVIKVENISNSLTTSAIDVKAHVSFDGTCSNLLGMPCWELTIDQLLPGEILIIDGQREELNLYKPGPKALYPGLGKIATTENFPFFEFPIVTPCTDLCLMFSTTWVGNPRISVYMYPREF